MWLIKAVSTATHTGAGVGSVAVNEPIPLFLRVLFTSISDSAPEQEHTYIHIYTYILYICMYNSSNT